MTGEAALPSASADAAPERAALWRERLRTGTWLPIGVVLALVAFFSLASDAFLTLRNATGILGQASTLLLACLGASFVSTFAAAGCGAGGLGPGFIAGFGTVCATASVTSAGRLANHRPMISSLAPRP